VEKVTSRHTPGPWKRDTNDYDHSIEITDKNGKPIASVYSDELLVGEWDFIMTQDEAKANVDLIVAAPELYEALKELLYQLDDLASNLDKWLENASKVIATAKQKSFNLETLKKIFDDVCNEYCVLSNSSDCDRCIISIVWENISGKGRWETSG